MFLDSGDGVVFVGDFGPWYLAERHEFHLPREKAKALRVIAEQLAPGSWGYAREVNRKEDAAVAVLAHHRVGEAADVAQLFGPHLSQRLDDATIRAIEKALVEHAVVFFRDQTLTPEQHKALGRRFGELHIHPAYPNLLDGHPEIMVIYADEKSKRVAGENWHSDVSCDPEPPMGSILYMHTIPQNGGGDTLFSNMYRAYETLSAPVRDLIDGLTAGHDGDKVFRVRQGKTLTEPAPRLERPLAPCGTFRWTVRARFLLNDAPRATEWMGAYDTMGGPVAPWWFRRGKGVPALALVPMSPVPFFPIVETPGAWLGAIRDVDGVMVQSTISETTSPGGIQALADTDAVTVHGPTDPAQRGGAISFALDGVHPHDVGAMLDRHGVCVRVGHHCAKPLMRQLGVAATARASLYLYNDEDDLQPLLEGIAEARSFFAR